MSYPPAETFWIEPTDMIAWGLRRYATTLGRDEVALRSPDAFKCNGGYHQALHYCGRAAYPMQADMHDQLAQFDTIKSKLEPSHDDARWPRQCDLCSYQFITDDTWQFWTERIYRTVDGREFVLHTNAPAPGAPSAPPGAMWDAHWMTNRYKQPDGIYLIVRLPNNRDWHVDSRASNCTRPNEDHQCWVRHGNPRCDPVTVDKNGDTCAAGAGSILSGDYHGFLQHGILTAG